MTKTMFHDQAKLVRPKPAGPRPRATQLHAGLPEYDPAALCPGASLVRPPARPRAAAARRRSARGARQSEGRPRCVPGAELQALRIDHFPETDGLHIDLAERAGVSARGLSAGRHLPGNHRGACARAEPVLGRHRGGALGRRLPRPDAADTLLTIDVRDAGSSSAGIPGCVAIAA